MTDSPLQRLAAAGRRKPLGDECALVNVSIEKPLA